MGFQGWKPIGQVLVHHWPPLPPNIEVNIFQYFQYFLAHLFFQFLVKKPSNSNDLQGNDYITVLKN